MNIFLTGATGYIGSRLVPRLHQLGHKVTCLVRCPESAKQNSGLKDAHLLKGNVADRQSLDGALDGHDVVIHLAVLGHLNETTGSEEDFFEVNVEGTRNILRECVKSQPSRILCFSSSAKYGMPENEVIDEHTPADPLTPYGTSKYHADQVVQKFVTDHKLPVMTLLFTHIYGPGETRDFLTICKMMKKGIFPQVGLSPNYYPALYIDDSLEAILTCLTKGRFGETYIITDDDPHDLREIRRLVRHSLNMNTGLYPVLPRSLGILGAHVIEKGLSLVGRSSPVKAKNIRSIASGRRFSIQKSKNELGFEPQIKMQQAIPAIIDWYVQKGLL